MSGNVNLVLYQYGRPDGFIHRYSYDADNRIEEVHTSTDGYVWNREARYTYYPHGHLARVELGKYNVQGMDYYYTLQGWLKGVNMPMSGDPGEDGVGFRTGTDAFAFALGYYEGDYKPINPNAMVSDTRDKLWDRYRDVRDTVSAGGLYNGNISWMSTDLPGLGSSNRMQAMVYGYDQLHRIVQARSLTEYDATGYAQRSTDPEAPEAYDVDYSYDPNGNLLTLQRRDSQTAVLDSLTYEYNAGTNRLRNTDTADGENHTYDEIGNLISDAEEGIDSIAWTPYGKVRAVIKEDNSEIRFRYDASGNRIAKIASGDTTVYVRDASGNVMGVYKNDTLIEQSIYGSSRLGLMTSSSKTGYRTLGGKKYELSNHLGNVLAVVTDNIHLDQDSTWAQVVNVTDYYPFGLAMDGRTENDSSYRYGFNGFEKDDEIYGAGRSYTAEFWQYDSRLGRRWNVDPLADDPRQIGMSPYSAFWNNPIRYNDPDGRCPDCLTGEDVSNALATDFLSVKHSLYNLVARPFGYEATFVENQKGNFETGFVETTDDFLTGSLKYGLDALSVVTFGRGGGATGRLIAKTPGKTALTNGVKEAVGESVHGNSKLSTKTNTLYKLETKEGEYLKMGVTSKAIPEKRYSNKFMEDKRMRVMDKGSRTDMLKKEKNIVETNPGPLNKEPWAGKMQKE